MNVIWNTKTFEELTVNELHDLLRLRVDVFVVEQACAYEEIDGRDPGSLHIIGYSENGELIACARVVPPGTDGLPHVGRVVVRKDHRGKGIAHPLMEHALDALKKKYGSKRSALAAQSPLEGFYGGFGYERIGKDYDWDGIPHVDMVREED